MCALITFLDRNFSDSNLGMSGEIDALFARNSGSSLMHLKVACKEQQFIIVVSKNDEMSSIISAIERQYLDLFKTPIEIKHLSESEFLLPTSVGSQIRICDVLKPGQLLVVDVIEDTVRGPIKASTVWFEGD